MKPLWTAVLSLGLAGLAACRTSDPDPGSALRDGPEGGTEEPGISPPFGAGTAPGDLRWEARFNFPPCDHPPRKKGAWCLSGDYGPARDLSGVEERLTRWANDPTVKSLHLAYFSFSNKSIAKLLCQVALERQIPVKVYLHKQNMGVENVQMMKQCAPGKLEVIARGTEFGSGYLQHAKIFLASEQADLQPLAALAGADQEAVAAGRIRFASSSANMSSYGTSVHLENWLFFDAPATERNAQENVCMFHAMRTMPIGPGIDERKEFTKINDACRKKIAAPPRDDVVFYPVPHGGLTPQPAPALEKLIKNAQSEVKVAIHRLTTGKIYGPLADKAAAGVKVHVIFDDDTFRTGKCNGGAALDVGAQDVMAYRKLKSAGVDVSFVETNGELPHLHHNKFVVVDEKILWQGAGNFTATSLNSGGPGNMEHFYLITIPEIVQTYSKAWDHLKAVSTQPENHEAFAKKDKGISFGGPTGAELDESSCDD